MHKSVIPDTFQMIACPSCNSPSDQHRDYVYSKIKQPCDLTGAPIRVVICKMCGFVFLNPQPKPDWLANFYRNLNYNGRSDAVDMPYLLYKKGHEKPFLFDWLTAQLPTQIVNQRILDIGSGYGLWLSWFDRSNDVIGIEPSVEVSEFSRKHFNFPVQAIDFFENQFEAESFDLITGLAIIEHFLDPLAAIVEMNRLLKPGGYLYLHTPDLNGMTLRKSLSNYFKLVHTVYFTATSLSSLLLKAGFEIVSVRETPCDLTQAALSSPERAKIGLLDIVARKIESISLDEARLNSPVKDNIEVLDRRLATALKRDRYHMWLNDIYKNPRFGKSIRQIIRKAGRLRGSLRKKFTFLS